ncbi:MAG: hypothetical protein ACP5MB_06395 [bacterium]
MANGMTGQTAVVAVQDKSIIAQFTVPAGQAAGYIAPVTLYPYGFNKSAYSSFTVPAGSSYQLINMGISSAPTVDAQVILNLNGIDQGENFVLSQMVTSNSAKFNVTQPIVLGPSDVLQVSIVTLAPNNSTTAVTETFVLQFLQVPK